MKKIVLLAALFIVSTAVFAQAPDPIDLDGPFAIPVDGGVSLLAIAGAAFGAKRMKKAVKVA